MFFSIFLLITSMATTPIIIVHWCVCLKTISDVLMATFFCQYRLFIFYGLQFKPKFCICDCVCVCAPTFVQDSVGLGVAVFGCADEVGGGDRLGKLHIHSVHLQQLLWRKEAPTGHNFLNSAVKKKMK